MLELNINLLINGNKFFSQRKPSGTVTPTASYQYLTSDRFAQKIAGTITTPLVAAGSDFANTNSPWCSTYTGTTTLGSSISEQQRVEADFGLNLIGKYLSYRGEVSSNSYSKATVTIGYASAKDNHATQIPLFTKDFTIKTDGTVTELVWDKIASLSSMIATGMYCEIVLSIPTNTSTSSTHKIGGQSLVRGRNAPIENLLASRSLIDELRYCQRYYEKSYDTNVAPGSISDAGVCSFGRTVTTSYYGVVPFKVTKAITPVVTGYSNITGASGYWRDSSVAADKAVVLTYQGLNGFAGTVSSITAGDAITGHFTASSEL